MLLHGGFGAGELFEPILPALSAERRVIAVDLPGHGGSPDPGRPLRAESFADDVAALITEPVDVMGYSLGGHDRAAPRDPAPRRSSAGWCSSRWPRAAAATTPRCWRRWTRCRRSSPSR